MVFFNIFHLFQIFDFQLGRSGRSKTTTSKLRKRKKPPKSLLRGEKRVEAEVVATVRRINLLFQEALRGGNKKEASLSNKAVGVEELREALSVDGVVGEAEGGLLALLLAEADESKDGEENMARQFLMLDQHLVDVMA